MNQFFYDKIVPRLTSDISDAASKDRQQFADYYKDQQPTPNLDEAFDFLFNIVKISPFQLINAPYNTHDNLKEKLAVILFSKEFMAAENKLSWIDNFTSALENDYEFFFHAFRTCLKNHEIEYMEQYLTPEVYNMYVEKNIELFTFLLDIGEHNHFHKFKEEDFLTTNKLYINILKDNKLLDNTFSLDKLIDNLETLSQQKGTVKINDFTISYLSDILDLPSTQPDFVSVIDKNNLIPMFAKNLEQLNTHIPRLILEPQDILKYKTLFIELLKNEKFSTYFHKSEPLNNIMIRYFPEAYISILDNFDSNLDFNKNLLYQEKYLTLNNTPAKSLDSFQSYPPSFTNILYLLCSTKMKPAHIELTKFLFEKVRTVYSKEGQKQNTDEYNEFYKSSQKSLDILLTAFLFSFSTKNVSKDNTKYVTPELIQMIENNFSTITRSFSILDDSNNRNSGIIYNLFNLNSTLSLLDTTQQQKLKTLIVSSLQTQIYESLINQEKTYQTRLNYISKQDVIYNISQVIKYSGLNEVLDIMSVDSNNPYWKNETFDYSKKIKNSGSKNSQYKVVYKDEYNIPFALIQDSDGKAFEWFVQEQNYQEFSKIKYKGKNFISYFNQEKWLVPALIKLSENTHVFKHLVLDNKPAMTALNKIINPDSKTPRVKVNTTVEIEKLAQIVSTMSLYNKIDKKTKPKEGDQFIVKPAKTFKI